MRIDQLTHDPESWQTIDPSLKDGASKPSTFDGEGDDATAAKRAAWQQVIDQKLIEWAGNPSQLEDDRLDPPSAELIRRAIDFARALQQAGYTPPTNVVPDANGGLVFHRRQQDTSEEIHFWDDGTVEYCRFHGARLVERRPL